MRPLRYSINVTLDTPPTGYATARGVAAVPPSLLPNTRRPQTPEFGTTENEEARWPHRSSNPSDGIPARCIASRRLRPVSVSATPQAPPSLLIPPRGEEFVSNLVCNSRGHASGGRALDRHATLGQRAELHPL